MKAVILAADKKDSLYPFTETKPTGLISLGKETIVERLIRQLQGAGVEDVYIVANHLQREFEEKFEEYTNVNIVTQQELEGTGNALKQCKFIEEDFLTVNGDVVVSQDDLDALVEKHKRTEPDATVLGTDEEKPEKFGVLSIVNDEVKDVHEKPEDAETNLVNTGIYCFSPEIFDHLEDDPLLFEVLNDLKSVRVELTSHQWMDIGQKSKLLEASRLTRENQTAEIHEEAKVADTAEVVGNVRVGKGAVIQPGAYVEGPSYIGKNAVIGPNAELNGVSLGRGTKIGSSTLNNCLVMEDTIIDSQCYLEDSIVAEGSDIKSCSALRQCFLGAESFIDFNNSMRGVKTVPNARTDLGEISK